MPTPRKRRVRAACGNILGGEPTAAQIAYSNDWWNTVLTEHSRNYAAERNGGKPFNNGERVLIGTASDYDGLISGGEPGDDTAMPAYATITCTDGDLAGADQFAEKEYFKITSAAGTAKHYVLTNATGGGVATGTVMSAGSDVGSTTLGSAIADLGVCIAVQVTINGGSESNQGQVLNELRTAIAHANGHNAGSANSVIQLSAALTPTDGNQVMKLQNVTAGAAGNVTITKPTGLTEFTVDGFTGGADALSAVVPHYWCDTNNAKAAIADAHTAALTTADGVIYDPSGPNSQYIPSLEDVSSGTALYIVVKPDGWNANDYISWELIGDTEASNDKLSMKAINASNVAAALEGVKSDGTMEAVTTKAGTVAYTGRTNYATANANGIAVVWESDGTGADDSSMKKGWYLRWKHTAV